MPQFIDRTGEKRIMNCGISATIVKYVNSHNITVQFEDGTLLEKRYYGDFQKGKINHPNFKEDFQRRVGDRRQMNCGLYATLVSYRKNTDVDVLFDDGVLIKNRLYQDFVRGEITHPKLKFDVNNVIGLQATMHCGMNAIVIAYRCSGDIDIQFEDGVIVRHCSLSAFKGCRIQHPKNKILTSNNEHGLGRRVVGEKNIMVCGLEATIIAYRTSKDIDIQFEDGSVVCNKMYGNFKKGKIEHPYIKPSASYPERIIAGFLNAAKLRYKTEWSDAILRGENGKKPLYFDFAIFDDCDKVVLLIEYQGLQHFEENKLFGDELSFKRLQTHDERKKEYAQAHNISLLEIPYTYSTVEEISSFLNSNLPLYSGIPLSNTLPISPDSIQIVDLKTSRLGETKVIKCGKKATVIAYRTSSDIDVQFDDGTIITGVPYRRFVLCDLVAKNFSYKERIAQNRIGETLVMKNGMAATIISYQNALDITIEFEDGTIRTKQSYSNFRTGSIGNPNFKLKGKSTH